MVSEAPPFWWTEKDWRAKTLAPLAWLYGRISRSRMERAPRRTVDAPVLCVGNFTVGGAGKTPTALALAERMIERGLSPGFLSRGYGGSIDTTTMVDISHHRARDVGDEPLLLAQIAPTVVSRNRYEGAENLIQQGVDIIVMDDGFQSAKVHFDFALMVIDSRRGIGNGALIPAGPVRAPIVDQLRHANALLTIGTGDASENTIRQASRSGKAVYQAELVASNASEFADAPVIAFAGIGDPAKFFRTLTEAGVEIIESRSFGDHHILDDTEIAELLKMAEMQSAQLVTTSKDRIRLKGEHGRADELFAASGQLNVDLKFEVATVADTIIDKTLSAYRQRRLKRLDAEKLVTDTHENPDPGSAH